MMEVADSRMAADLGKAEAGAEREGDDRVIAEVAGGRAEDQSLLVGRERGRGEVRHGGLQAAQVRSLGEEVKAGGFDSRATIAAQRDPEDPIGRPVSAVEVAWLRGSRVSGGGRGFRSEGRPATLRHVGAKPG